LLPARLEDPAHPGPDGVHRFREHDAPTNGAVAAWLPPDDKPLVYLTFGTAAPQMGFFPDLYRAAIDTLAPLPVNLLVTTGRDRDPADLGPLPANVRVERWLPQADVLRHARAMVCHGGTGTVRGALAQSVPVAVLPLFADQPHNAARVAEVGAGLVIEPQLAGLAEAVQALLTDARFAARAAEVAADIRALPTVDTAVDVLKKLIAKDGLQPGAVGIPGLSR
jgi:MGT family glycosyltransferase